MQIYGAGIQTGPPNNPVRITRYFKGEASKELPRYNIGSLLRAMRPSDVQTPSQLHLRPQPHTFLRTCFLFSPFPLEGTLALPLPPPIHDIPIYDNSVLRRSALQSALRQADQAQRNLRDGVPRPHTCRRRRQAQQAAGKR